MRIISLILGFILDAIIGDPQGAPHPVRAIGKLIALCDRTFNKGSRLRRTVGGILTLVIVWAATAGCLLLVYIIPLIIISVLHYQGLMYYARIWWMLIFVILDSIVFYYSLAAKDLKKEALDVYDSLVRGDIQESRWRLSRIVGRDTESLDEEGIIKATVETVAENASDGVLSPIIFYALFGGIGVWIFKATSTMDSMIGYRDEKYQYFGTAAAKMDDLFNLIPARITAWLILLLGPAVIAVHRFASFLRKKDCCVSRFGWIDKIKVYFKFNKCSPSPNSAHPESAMAGVLGIRLGGPAVYKGILHDKPYIGAERNRLSSRHIILSCAILGIISVALLIICIIGIYSILKLIPSLSI